MECASQHATTCPKAKEIMERSAYLVNLAVMKMRMRKIKYPHSIIQFGVYKCFTLSYNLRYFLLYLEIAVLPTCLNVISSFSASSE
jgi:uncharacterized membrane protein